MGISDAAILQCIRKLDEAGASWAASRSWPPNVCVYIHVIFKVPQLQTYMVENYDS